MRIEPLEQLMTALAALFTGFAAGVVYDFFRAWRRKLKSAVFTAAADIFFCVFALAALFLIAFISGGSQRIYILAFCAVGFALYYRFLSRSVMRLFGALIGGLGQMVRLLLRPFGRLYTKLQNCNLIVKKSIESVKKQYIIIIRKFVYSGNKRKSAAITQAEGKSHEEKKGRIYY